MPRNRSTNEFNIKGFTVVRNCVHASWIRNFRDTLTATCGPLTDLDHLLLTKDLGARAVTQLSATNIGGVVADLLGSDNARLVYHELLNKRPGDEGTPWHQDLPYWPLVGRQICSVWLALDDTTESNGALKYVEGSHRSGEIYRPKSRTMNHGWNDVDLTPIPDDADTIWPTETCALSVGDCVIHHGLTLHSSYPIAATSNGRAAYISRWIGNDVFWMPRRETMAIPMAFGLTVGQIVPNSACEAVFAKQRLSKI